MIPAHKQRDPAKAPGQLVDRTTPSDLQGIASKSKDKAAYPAVNTPHTAERDENGLIEISPILHDLGPISRMSRYLSENNIQVQDGRQELKWNTIGAILTYYNGGRIGGASGQTIGANCTGQFAVIIEGEPSKAREAAVKYLRSLTAEGYYIKDANIVENEQLFSGNSFHYLKAE